MSSPKGLARMETIRVVYCRLCQPGGVGSHTGSSGHLTALPLISPGQSTQVVELIPAGTQLDTDG